jgi:hypothetical protein
VKPLIGWLLANYKFSNLYKNIFTEKSNTKIIVEHSDTVWHRSAWERRDSTDGRRSCLEQKRFIFAHEFIKKYCENVMTYIKKKIKRKYWTDLSYRNCSAARNHCTWESVVDSHDTFEYTDEYRAETRSPETQSRTVSRTDSPLRWYNERRTEKQWFEEN